MKNHGGRSTIGVKISWFQVFDRKLFLIDDPYFTSEKRTYQLPNLRPLHLPHFCSVYPLVQLLGRAVLIACNLISKNLVIFLPPGGYPQFFENFRVFFTTACSTDLAWYHKPSTYFQKLTQFLDFYSFPIQINSFASTLFWFWVLFRVSNGAGHYWESWNLICFHFFKASFSFRVCKR